MKMALVIVGTIFGVIFLLSQSGKATLERKATTSTCEGKGEAYYRSTGDWPTMRAGLQAGRSAGAVAREYCSRKPWIYDSQ